MYNFLSRSPRIGLTDNWNAFMVKNAKFSNNDIPLFKSNYCGIPTRLISYPKAKAIYNKEIKAGNKDFKYDAFIHFYVDDQYFDGKESSIWLYPYKALEIITHFSGIIAPDFSTYADFPEPLKRFNFYRMAAFGCWISDQGIPVISNCRWGTAETWDYCFDGNPKNGIICIGTVASGIKLLSNRFLFENGLFKMIEILYPKIIIVYGSAKYHCFDLLRKQGITIVEFQSETNIAFARRYDNE